MPTKDVSPGEWVRPKMTGYLMECCKCGAVHKMDFLVDPKTGFAMRGKLLSESEAKAELEKLK